MALTNKIIVGSGLLLLSGLVNAGALPGPQTATTDDQQVQATQAPDEEATQTETPTTVQQPAADSVTVPQPASGQATPATGQTPVPAAQTPAAPPGLPPGTTTPVPVAPIGAAPGTTVAPSVVPVPPGTVPPGPVAPGTVAPGTTVAPGVVPPGTVPPGIVAPGTVAPGTTAPAVYVPKTEFDNTPHRFNMTQGGKQMSADDFDAWMRAKGYRVAKGAPPADCPNAPPTGVETIVGPDGCPVEVSIELDGVTFEFAKSTLHPEARKTLDQAAEILKRHPELTVEVAGHTDSRGAADFNQKLSETRAKAVYDYLIQHGIRAKQLEGPIGYGESKPVASNDTDAGRDQNRRTELNIKAVAALPAPTVAGAAPAQADGGAIVVEGQSESADGAEAEGVAGSAAGTAATPGAAPDVGIADGQAAVPAMTGTVDGQVAAPAADAAASGQAGSTAAVSGAANGQLAAPAAIETTAAGHLVVPAEGGTTATGHVIVPTTTGATTGQANTPAATAGQTPAPTTATDQQADALEADALEEGEAASEVESASDDDE